MKKSSIHLQIALDKENTPEEIQWSADDAPFKGQRKCKAFLLSIWDEKEGGAMRIDLWNKDMRVDEMDRFFHQTLATLADTYKRSTGNDAGSKDIRAFAEQFAKKSGVLK